MRGSTVSAEATPWLVRVRFLWLVQVGFGELLVRVEESLVFRVVRIVVIGLALAIDVARVLQQLGVEGEVRLRPGDGERGHRGAGALEGLGAVGAYKALSNYTQLGGVLTVFTVDQ